MDMQLCIAVILMIILVQDPAELVMILTSNGLFNQLVMPMIIILFVENAHLRDLKE